MKLFDVYSLQPIEPVKASGSWLWDKTGNQYLDLYGGHAVISVGHNHPRYVEAITRQLEKISFYSNSVQSSIQEELAEKLAMPLEKVRKVLKIAKEPISLETPIGDEEDSHLGDFIEDKNAILPIDAAIQSNLRETTTRVLASLTPREDRKSVV
mgnify:CR=1 FL=1